MKQYKTKYERCKAEHRCPNCFNAHDGKFLYCDTCREWRKKYTKQRYCVDCHSPIPKGTKFKRCPTCKEKNDTKYQKSWYASLTKEQRNEMREYHKNYAKKWRRKNPEKYQDTTLKRRYDISFLVAQNLYHMQKGKCGICGTHIPKLTSRTKTRYNSAHIDHDHKTNKVRGLLCPHCNYLLGNCKDDISILEKAILYLSKPETNFSFE